MAAVKELSKRKFFTKLEDAVSLPDLVEVQKSSYKWFLEDGLKELFDEISPVKDFIGRDFELRFLDYYCDEPKFDELASKAKNLTYEFPLRVKTELVNNRTKESSSQEVYLGDLPIMTDRGTFIINGIERVVVSQLIRSAGVFFTSEFLRNRNYYGAKVIPNRGAWIEIETDINNILWVRIDRKRKVAVTTLLRAFGFDNDEVILDLFKTVDTDPTCNYIRNTLEKDISHNEAEGLIEIYKRIRPGDLATPDNAKSLIYSMFFNFSRYDFGRVGRYKLNQHFGEKLTINKENRILRKEDLVNVIKKVISLNNTQVPADDIDHLGNRRVRAVGELVQNKFRIGLARMERIIKDRMSTLDVGEITPNHLINSRPVIGAVKEFFMSSRLSQFMDQINPLSELEHKRRLSAMGPGGLSRERAGFEVRDVHPTHYGRICPIATPEGPNIGLVGHLASYARINEYGFIETPYRKVIHSVPNSPKETEGKVVSKDVKDSETNKEIIKAGEIITDKLAVKLAKLDLKEIPIKPKVTNEVEYLDAFLNEQHITTAATTPLDENNNFVADKASVRENGQPTVDSIDRIDYMDVSPKQIISISTSLIPFLEHDDAVRALMGSNMQRQAVACISPQAPIVGTGIEAKAAKDSGQLIIANQAGKVVKIGAGEIHVLEKSGDVKVYILNKFVRSNASTCINNKVVVDVGQTVKVGDVLADGPAMEGGELALGQNVLVAFMTFYGWNYEDAILISEKLVQDNRYTSIHIEDYVVDVRDTKLGAEVVTRDIPNISEERLKDLDEEGIVRLGAQVSPGDILVGKITPKGETELSAEERLLRAIFDEKAKDVRDSSLYLEHSGKGKIVDIKIFSRDQGDKLPAGVVKSIQISVANLRKIQVGDKMAGRHGNKGVVSKIVPIEDLPFLEDGTPVDIILTPLGIPSRMNQGQILETHLGLAAKKLGYKVASPPLNGVSEEIIKRELEKAGFNKEGKEILYNGKTGEAFDNKVTIGQVYMLKLNHLVEDKIHQRSIGPYSLVTQQPLGGKAQNGGQRFGEMEVWALEAYGAAHTLKEMLTIKSDDVPGRSKAYESIIKGEPITRLNIPESFNVLVRELKGLGLNVELLNTTGQSTDKTSQNESDKNDNSGKKSEKNSDK